ncbi:porin family protein [Alcanivorax sp. ZXX171]|nr:porin family protein [Alcanivorax sp. ZXX171]
MKANIAALAVPLIGLGLLSSVHADEHSPAYLSLGYGHHEQDDRFFGDDRFETGELIGKLGGRVNNWFGVEMRAGTTINKNEDDLRGLPGVKGEYAIEYFYGLYAKLSWANRTAFTPYLLGGYTEGKEKLDTDIGEEDQKFHDSSYGAGVDMDVNERVGLNVEYMFYYDKDNVTLKGPAASVYWKF